MTLGGERGEKEGRGKGRKRFPSYLIDLTPYLDRSFGHGLV